MNLRKYNFMFHKFLSDFDINNVPYLISDDLFSSELGEYYFLFEENASKLNKLINGFDKDGIPVNKPYIDVEENKPHYYPISIGQYGLAVFNSFVHSKEETKREHFLRIADWYVNNKTEDIKLGTYWFTNIPKPEYKIDSAWKSAFTQSRAISVLLRAWQITSDEKYFLLAKNALKIFSVDIKNNGVAVIFDFGVIYEEYAAKEPTMVLDGHIFSLFGLFDFIRVSKSFDFESHQFAENLFDKGITALLKLLPEYDMGYWVKFNLCKMNHYPKLDPCTVGYVKLISLQLDVLYKITGRNEFDEYARKFKSYLKYGNIFRMLPIKYKSLKKLNRL